MDARASFRLPAATVRRLGAWSDRAEIGRRSDGGCGGGRRGRDVNTRKHGVGRGHRNGVVSFDKRARNLRGEDGDANRLDVHTPVRGGGPSFTRGGATTRPANPGGPAVRRVGLPRGDDGVQKLTSHGRVAVREQLCMQKLPL